jgi:hypothetical protein
MFKTYLQNGGQSSTIKELNENGGLSIKHFNNMT